eukprot:scaffold81618_cov46-Attheya_sp.AAC.1
MLYVSSLSNKFPWSQGLFSARQSEEEKQRLELLDRKATPRAIIYNGGPGAKRTGNEPKS